MNFSIKLGNIPLVLRKLQESYCKDNDTRHIPPPYFVKWAYKRYECEISNSNPSWEDEIITFSSKEEYFLFLMWLL